MADVPEDRSSSTTTWHTGIFSILLIGIYYTSAGTSIVYVQRIILRATNGGFKTVE